MCVKPPEKPTVGEEGYDAKFRRWNEWDDDNFATRTIMINTMSEAQLLKYSFERTVETLWNLIKFNMAAETEQLKTLKSLSELTNLKIQKEEHVDDYINRAEGLRNKCKQLGKNIEDFELKMFLLKGLRTEFESHAVLKHLRDETQEAIETLQALQRPVDHWDDLLVHMMMQKPDPTTNRDWELSSGNSKVPTTWAELEEFLLTRLQALVNTKASTGSSTSSQTKTSSNRKISIHTASKKEKQRCTSCLKGHPDQEWCRL